MKIGLIQMAAGMDKQVNLEKAAVQVAACKAAGAQLAALPEIFNGPYSNDYFRSYAEPEGGESWQALSRMAAENGFASMGADYSPIKGPEGNIEFLLHVQKAEAPEALTQQMVVAVVERAHQELDR